jgi:glycosyltransferase involved in cell wall biosynthesis
MSGTGRASFRARLYNWGRRTLPLGWRRSLRRTLPVERLFGIRKPRAGSPPSALTQRQMVPREGQDFVFLPVIPWSYRRQRPQQLAAALVRRGRRVFYGTLGEPGEDNEEPGVQAGVVLLPIDGIRWEDPPERELRGGALRRAEEALVRAEERFGLRDVALIAQSPYWEPLTRRLRERLGWKVVYDCLDDYASFSSNRAAVLTLAEERLAPRADLVVATSSLLLQKLARANPNSRLLPNACDYEFLCAIGDPAPEGDRLRIGYIGALDDWFDCGLVADLARRRPEWTFDLVGEPHHEVRRALRGLPNVLFRGERPHGEIPSLLEAFDVLAIPYVLNPLTHAADPVKLYEAFAAGRAVVATPMTQLELLAARGLVRLAATADDFERELLAAAAEGSQAASRRRAYARENTWEVRARDLDAAVSSLFAVSA